MVYEQAFQSMKRRKVYLHANGEVNNTTSMRSKRARDPPGLLVASSTILSEALGIFHKGTRFSIRCEAVEVPPRREAALLRQAAACSLWKHVKHLNLTVAIDHVGNPHAMASQLQQIVSSLDNGRNLSTLTLTFWHDDVDDWSPCPSPEDIPIVLDALNDLRCSGRFGIVEWQDFGLYLAGKQWKQSRRFEALAVQLGDRIAGYVSTFIPLISSCIR